MEKASTKPKDNYNKGLADDAGFFFCTRVITTRTGDKYDRLERFKTIARHLRH